MEHYTKNDTLYMHFVVLEYKIQSKRHGQLQTIFVKILYRKTHQITPPAFMYNHKLHNINT